MELGKSVQNNRGFTLIELMVTIAVLAIITTIAAPSFSNLLEKQNLNRSTQELISILKMARSKAVLERREVKVVLNSRVEDTPSQLNWNVQGKSHLKSGSPTEIIFQLNGGVKNYSSDISGKPFIICDKNGGSRSKNVQVALMGTVEVIEGTC